MGSIDETVKGLNKELQFARENLKRVEKELAEVRSRPVHCLSLEQEHER